MYTVGTEALFGEVEFKISLNTLQLRPAWIKLEYSYAGLFSCSEKEWIGVICINMDKAHKNIAEQKKAHNADVLNIAWHHLRIHTVEFSYEKVTDIEQCI